MEMRILFFVEAEMKRRFLAAQMWKRSLCFRLMRNFLLKVVLHDYFRRPNVWPCDVEPPMKHIFDSPLHRESDRLREHVCQFTWVAWVVLHDSSGLLVSIIIPFHPCSHSIWSIILSVGIYFHIFFQSFCIFRVFTQKNMKTNVILIHFVRFHSYLCAHHGSKFFLYPKCRCIYVWFYFDDFAPELVQKSANKFLL
jgi:hypothetical protein